jgi:hypothetical protein
MKVLVASHGHCFDGLCSATLFTKLLRQVEGRPVAFQYRAAGYGIGQYVPRENTLDCDVNAILDYRYTPSQRVTWYFDHHRTAFESAQAQAFFEAKRAEAKSRYHFDASCTSCTKLIDRVAQAEFGISLGCDSLVQWANRVDSAAFSSAEEAVSQADPVMRFVCVVESAGNDAFYARWVSELLARPLEEVATHKVIRELYAPLGDRQTRFVQAVRQKAEQRGRVVYVDLTERPLETLGKFVTYALYPESVYSVVVAQMKHGYKISVGYNPWCGQSLDTDISSICARYGGGGHPVVGGVSIPAGERARAQQLALSIASELDGEPSSSVASAGELDGTSAP